MKRVIALAGIVTVLSACGSATPAPPSSPSASPALSLPAEQPGPGDHQLAMAHDGVRRDFTLHAPAAYRPGLPVVLVLHGYGSDAAGAVRQSGLNAVADRAGFLAVYPQGLGGAWDPGAGGPTGGDVGFLAALADHLVTVWGADRTRVYAAGFSAGAAFTYRLARELPGRFAAIAPVSGRMDNVPAWRTPLGAGNPVSVVTFQGGRDQMAGSWDGTNEAWSAAAGCGTPKAATVRNARGSAERRVATCANGAEHVVYAIPAMGHEWPNATEHPVAAAELMWEVFSRHRLP